MADFVYKWTLGGSFVDREAFPVYGNALAVEWAKESEQKFYRQKVSGKIKFVGKDYADIMSDPFGQKFTVNLIKYQGGSLFAIFVGYFYKTDCEIDVDAQTIEATISIEDAYQEILDGIDKEFNLVKLAPEIVKIQMQKRPLIQIYRPGYPVIGNVLSGMYWEQEAKEIAESEMSDYYFSTASSRFFTFTLDGSGDIGGDLPDVFLGVGGTINDPITKDGYTIESLYDGGLNRYVVRLTDANNQVLWIGYRTYTQGRFGNYLMVPQAGQTGSLEIVVASEQIYCRLLCDVATIGGQPTYALPTDDITDNSQNYSRAIGYTPINAFGISDEESTTPTEFGIMPNDNYYKEPYWPFGRIIPALRSTWDYISIWWLGSPLDWIVEEEGRGTFTLNDAYPLWSVISVLLSAIGASVTFAGNSTYSRFLYGDGGGVRGASFEPFITPKSNLISAEYDQAAQRGTITLRAVFDMLRDCFKCYWFISGGKLRIEHIQYFRNGGDYYTTPIVGIDLTSLYYSRSGKPVATGQNRYKYNKPETYGRIQWGWMDDVTAPFEGEPIDIISPYVNKASIKDITISQFTSDVDYIIANPNDISKEGFILLCAVDDGNGNKSLPFVTFGDYSEYVLQNGYLSFLWLQRYYMYDLPAPDYEIAGESGIAIGVQRLIEQEVNFPAEFSPDLAKLVKTGLGNGMIESLSYELLSKNCKAKLSYEPS